MTVLDTPQSTHDSVDPVVAPTPPERHRVDVPVGGAAPWWQEGLRPAQVCPAQGGGRPHAVSVAPRDQTRPLDEADGFVVGLGGGNAAVDDEAGQVAVLVYRCVWCKATLVGVGAQLSKLGDHRWYELASPESRPGICLSATARQAAVADLVADPYFGDDPDLARAATARIYGDLAADDASRDRCAAHHGEVREQARGEAA